MPHNDVGVRPAHPKPSPSNAATSFVHPTPVAPPTARASAKPQLGLAGGLTLFESLEAFRPPAERSGQVVPAFGLGGEGCLLKQLHKLGDGAAGGLGLHPTLQFLHSKPLTVCLVVTICAPWGRGWPRWGHSVAPAMVTGLIGDD